MKDGPLLICSLVQLTIRKRAMWVMIGLAALCSEHSAAMGIQPHSSAQCLRYSVDLIGPVWCDFFYSPIGVGAISELGEMTGGGGTCSGPNSAFAWYGQMPLVYLPFPSGMSGQATGINSNCDIVGYMGTKSGGGNDEAFIYKSGAVQSLGGLPNYLTSFAFGVNEEGIVCGRSDGITGQTACIWRNGQIEPLTLPIGPSSSAWGIADDGRVCGSMGSHAFIWSPDEVVDLGIVLPNAMWSFGASLNTQGGLCGISTFSDPKYVFIRRSFFWKDGVAQDLGMLFPWINCYANSINDDNIIVGHCTGEAAGGDAFLWKDGVMHNLEDLIVHELDFSLINATSINDAGQIAAYGHYPAPNGFGQIYVAMRLNPIPPLTGDLNCDWQVNVPDLLGVISAWGPCPPQPPGEPFTETCHADFNDDGVVNHHDIIAVVLNWTP